MGEEKKEEGKGEKKEEEGKNNNNSEEEKKNDDEKKQEQEGQPPQIQEIVLKVDMHCEACARKVARSLKGFQGVENVTTDCKGSKVVVKGKDADPVKVCERIHKKSGRKVELISPLPKPPDDQDANKQQDKPPVPEKKDEAPAVITVVLRVQMHCDACAQVLQKRIRKIKGVESVTADIGKNEVIVKGTVDPEKLVADVYKKTGKQASIVKDEEEKKEEEKKEEEKKEGGGGDGGKEEEDKKSSSSSSSDSIKKSEYWPQRYYYMEYAAAYPPQIFSDENPNACILM